MDRRAAESAYLNRAYLIRLAGREVEYRFVRRRRRTLGITVDADGLKVSAPLRAPWRDIEGFVREKEHWILAKLDEWSVALKPVRLRGVSGERLPLFGEMLELRMRHGPGETRRRQPLRSECGLSGEMAQARGTGSDEHHAWRHFAALLGQPTPRVALSNARTQWGVCTEGGSIRLSWRLVHIEPALADYVVAHETAHLVELNHSRRFWTIVERLYPGWQEARERLELAGAALPIFPRNS